MKQLRGNDSSAEPFARARGLVVRRVLAGAATIAATSAFVAACAHDDSTVFIRAVMAPPATGAQNGVCTYTADPTQPQLSSGTLDIGLTSSYSAHVLVGNQLSPRSSTDGTRTETSRFSMQGAVVHVTDVGGAEINSFTSLGTGLADPALSGQPGYGLVSVILVDSATVQKLAGSLSGNVKSKTVVARFKIFGQTLGGLDEETDEFPYPITVCNGCLVNFPADSVDQALARATGKPNCSAAASAGATSAACTPGQDQPVDCRTCQNNPVCVP